jgi:hypothetical protein
MTPFPTSLIGIFSAPVRQSASRWPARICFNSSEPVALPAEGSWRPICLAALIATAGAGKNLVDSPAARTAVAAIAEITATD